MTFNLSFKFFPHGINGTIVIGQLDQGTQSCHQRDQNGSLSGIFFPGRRSESQWNKPKSLWLLKTVSQSACSLYMALRFKIYFPENMQRKIFWRNRKISSALNGNWSQLSFPLHSESQEFALQFVSKHWSGLVNYWAMAAYWVHCWNIEWHPKIFFFFWVYCYSLGYLLGSLDFVLLFSYTPMYSLSYSLGPYLK